MNFTESFRIAMKAIWVNKMRSLLTMLGIIIGISSVIAVVSLGSGTESAIRGEFESFGVNRIFLTMNWSEDLVRSDYITKDDYNAIARIFEDQIKGISPSYGQGGKTTPITGEQKDVDLTLNGVNHQYQNIQAFDLIDGRFLQDGDDQSARNVVVIEKKVAEEVFGRLDVVGERLRVNTGAQQLSLLIIGVYEPPGSALPTVGAFEQPLNVYIPYTLMEKLFGMGQYVYYTEINFHADVSSEEMIEEITTVLERRHQNENKYQGFSAEGQLEMVNSIMGILTAVVSAIAAISLVVGGIGVMNIMLVSVTERTREIGIRKALGARHKDILMQFLVESVIISTLGGVLGTLLGIAFGYGVASFIDIPPATSPGTILIAWLFSAGVGIFFGIYPANKAAKLDPIEALRYE
jgi:putative ABC transport system permease protein